VERKSLGGAQARYIIVKGAETEHDVSHGSLGSDGGIGGDRASEATGLCLTDTDQSEKMQDRNKKKSERQGSGRQLTGPGAVVEKGRAGGTLEKVNLRN